MKHTTFSVFISLACFVMYTAIAQISPQDMVNKMGRGINMGNVMSAPVEGNWAPAFTESYFQDIALAGFKTVRIPIDFFGNRTSGDTSIYSKNEGSFASYTGTAADYVVSSAYLDRVEQVINWGLNQNLVVILDFHGSTLKNEFIETFNLSKAPDLYTYPNSAKRAADNEKFRAIWTQIANRFKDYTYDLVFEVINEPFFNITDIEMDVINTDIINIIRNTGSNNNDRNIIITGGSKNSFEAPLQIGNSVLSLDDNLIATFHYYWPRAFTASASQQHSDYDWGDATDKAEIDTNFGAVKTWSQNNNIPVLVGEFGADNEGGYNYSTKTYGAYGGPEQASRVEYHRYLAEKSIALGFSFTAWDAGDEAGKTIYKVTDRTWVEDVKNALLGISGNCTSSGIIENADIECGYNNSWALIVQGTSAATYSNANSLNSRNNTTSMEVNVTAAGANNSVIIENTEVVDATLSGNSYTFSGFAKASGTNQSMRIRLRVEDNLGNVTYPGKNITLSNLNYTPWTFDYTVPANTASLKFQVLCGGATGSYYLDDFNVQEKTLSLRSKKQNHITLFPNPAMDVVNINSKEKINNIALFDYQGKQVRTYKPELKQLNLQYITPGLYILRLNLNDNTLISKKLSINL
ncbi:cellulase family glycosylhydrolase [Siansivirga zeaxanthinifaciens]|nr:cellulase family glycosylhydrolase [Siansivirga zeaxanthinifaciens]